MIQILNKINRHFLTIITLIFIPTFISSQTNYSSTVEILQSLKKLNVLGSALYIAAHPDDENTSVLTYLSKGMLVKTAYLSLTRGDGGQNLLGNEKGDLLGVIRTQEPLSARKIDGAEQFFTRAIDFGYSKTPDETMRHWDRQKILEDIVYVIRKFRPDIILTRFSKTQGGHGHHLASAILAEEAFFAAADPTQFSEQLNKLEPWQAKRLLWNTFIPSKNAFSIDIGEFNPIIGKSYQEIASGSRSMHKSQGFGVGAARGSQLDFFDHMAGDTANTELFENIDISWKRISNSSRVQELINQILNKFDPEFPHKIIPELVEVYQQLDLLGSGYWIDIKKKEVSELIRRCSGLWLESIVWESGISPGENIDIRSTVINRSNYPVKLEKVSATYLTEDSVYNKMLEENAPFSMKQKVHIPENVKYSQPYWLENPHDGNMFSILDNQWIGYAENPPALVTQFYININDVNFKYEAPVFYRRTDPVEGELFKPVSIRPKLSISIENPVYIFNGQNFHEIQVHLKTLSKNAKGNLSVVLPKGWKVQPEIIPFHLNEINDQSLFIFRVTSDLNAVDGNMVVRAEMNGRTYDEQIIEIDYPHISAQTVLQKSKTKLIKLDIKTEPRAIGYIMGSGDDIPQSLKQLGYNVDLLSDEDLENKDLSIYDVIICGVRAFNTRDQLGRQQKRLTEFVENGGTWIVQHNTRFGTQVKQIGPYPFTSSGRDRITEENAPVQILMPDHSMLNFPNKITEKDFDCWVQERGLYFADNWQGKLYPLLAGNDQGEPSKLGGLLYAPYGKGVFIYTAYSWFRQIPAGVPGAYRLFVNLISAKGKN